MRSFVPSHHVRRNFALGKFTHTAPEPRDNDSTKVFICSPTYGVTLRLVLLVQPKFKRPEIIRQRTRIHFLLASQRLKRFLPWLALPQRQHVVQPLAGSFVVVNR